MSNDNTSPQNSVPGFWTRLCLALDALGESHDGHLERRIKRLEAEVERLVTDGRAEAQRRESVSLHASVSAVAKA